MAGKSRVEEAYSQFKGFLAELNGSEFYVFFENSVQSSPSNVKLFEKYVNRQIDFVWLEAIEESIIPIDTIIRDPKRFIKTEEDIVPIEMARNIGPESIRHLSQHTNMIESVEKDGSVVPGRILNIVKEESFDTYENRFIYTLLLQIQYFLDKRMASFMKGAKMDDRFEYEIDGKCDIGKDKLNYHFNMSYTTPHVEVDDIKLLDADVSTMTPLERVERVRKILYAFQASQFSKAMSGCALVRPPLVMTNVLKKNPNFAQAVKLWGFINSYNELGYSIDYVERYRTPSKEDRREMFAVLMLQYIMMKSQTHRTEDTADYSERQNELAPNVVRRSVEEICNTFDLSVDEVRRIYEKEFEREDRKKSAVLASTRAMFERAIAFERIKNDNIKRDEREKRRDAFFECYKKAFAESDAIRTALRLKAEEEARIAAEEEARRIAEEEARIRAEEEARQRAEEEAIRKADEEARRKLEELARIAAEAEAARKAEESRKLKAKIEASRKKSGTKTKSDNSKYKGMSRKKKKKSQKQDGVYKGQKGKSSPAAKNKTSASVNGVKSEGTDK